MRKQPSRTGGPRSPSGARRAPPCQLRSLRPIWHSLTPAASLLAHNERTSKMRPSRSASLQGTLPPGSSQLPLLPPSSTPKHFLLLKMATTTTIDGHFSTDFPIPCPATCTQVVALCLLSARVGLPLVTAQVPGGGSRVATWLPDEGRALFDWIRENGGMVGASGGYIVLKS